jgi:tetratricopeptide (TPR) repeat protein
MVRRVGESANGVSLTCPVRGGAAVLPSLEDGAYDVWRLAAGEREFPKDRSPDRRFLVETADPEIRDCVASAVFEKPAFAEHASSFEQEKPRRFAPPDCGATRRGWDLLERRAWYSAHREFSDALTAAAKGSENPSNGAAPERWKQILDETSAVDLSTPAGRRSAEAIGAELARLFERRPEAARTLHGLARTYAELARDERPLAAGASERAAACWRAAATLDPACVDSRNDLGLFYFERGWVEDAAECFRDAARIGTDPAPLYNLGRCLEAEGLVYDAMLAYERALAVDDQMHAATASLCRLQLLPGAPAIYEDEVPLLLRRLSDVARFYESRREIADWAAEASRRLADLAAECRWNRPGMAVRRLLPRETNPGTSELLGARRPSRSTSASPDVDAAASGYSTTCDAGESGNHPVRNAHFRITGVEVAPRRNP